MFTSCSKDDDEKTSGEDLTPVAAVMDYALTVGDDMLNTLNLTVEYYDANGKVQTETLTQKRWTKNIRAKLPAKLGVRLKAQLKDGINPTTIEKFTAEYGYYYNGYAVSANDKVVGNVVSYGPNSTTQAMKGDKINLWLENHTNGVVKFLFDFAANGQATDSQWQ